MKKYLFLIFSVFAFAQPSVNIQSNEVIKEEIPMKEHFILRFKKGVIPENFFMDNGLSNYKKISEGLYNVTTKTKDDVINLSNQIKSSGLFTYAQGHFIYK